MCDDDKAIAANHEKDWSFGTKLVHSGHHPDEWTYKDVVAPISIGTIYHAESPGVIKVPKTNDVQNLTDFQTSFSCSVYLHYLCAGIDV